MGIRFIGGRSLCETNQCLESAMSDVPWRICGKFVREDLDAERRLAAAVAKHAEQSTNPFGSGAGSREQSIVHCLVWEAPAGRRPYIIELQAEDGPRIEPSRE